MSFEAIPGLYGFADPADQCLTCWATGESPQPMIVNAAGIIRGPMAGPGDPPAPNGSYRVPHVGSCTLDNAPDVPAILADLTSHGFMTIAVAGPINAFTALSGPACQRHWDNLQTTPGSFKYNFGTVNLDQFSGAGDGFSTWDVMEKVVFPMGPGIWANKVSTTSTQSWHQFTRRQDGSNLLVATDSA